jgi:uncharacterized protein (TIGR02284 family)
MTSRNLSGSALISLSIFMSKMPSGLPLWTSAQWAMTSSALTELLHQGWINLKSAITGGNYHAILAECERGEDSAVEEYKKALDDGLTPSVQELVSPQFADIKAAHDRIRSLGDATKS